MLIINSLGNFNYFGLLFVFFIELLYVLARQHLQRAIPTMG